MANAHRALSAARVTHSLILALALLLPWAAAGHAAAQPCTTEWTFYSDTVGPDRFVRGLTLHSGLLYARGDWAMVGGAAGNNLAVFNGTTWSGTVAADWPYSGSPAGNTGLLSHNSKLFAPLGGASISAGFEVGAVWSGGTPGSGSWTGWPTTGLWTNPNVVLNINRCWRVGTHAGTIYAAGSFYFDNGLGGGDRRLIAGFDGSSWNRMGGGYGPDVSASDRIESIVSYKGDLYVAGFFSAVRDGEQFLGNTSPASNIARWRNGVWEALPNGGLSARVYTMAVYGDELHVGGDFTSTADGTISLARIARFNGTSWSPIGLGFTSSRPRSMCVADDGRGLALFVGATSGFATNTPAAGGDTVTVSGLVRWDGTRYTTVGAGLTGGIAVYAMARFDPGTGEALFVGADSIVDPADMSVLARTARYGPPVMPDTDGDGIFDAWETSGIDGDCDGSIDVVLEGANPLRKDLYIEVDAMSDRALNQAAVDAVIAAFAAAPVSNPDGSTGVTLHVTRVETDIIPVDFPNQFGEFHPIKRLRFANPDDRIAPNAKAVIDAKRRVYRYCIMGNRHSGSLSSGFGEIHGDDFTVTLGALPPSNAQAATFMHELGHTLGLYHGGHQIDLENDSRYNFKPNYRSIMNYSWQFAFNRTGYVLDYSREILAPLNEAALLETVGVGAPYAAAAQFGPHPREFHSMNFAVNYDRDTEIDVDPVAVDINAVREGHSHPGDTLEGSEDWSRIKYNFRNSPNYADGYSVETSEEMDMDLTPDLEDLNNTSGCAADYDGNATREVSDIFAFLTDWFADVPAAYNFGGTPGVPAIFAFLTAWFAGCP